MALVALKERATVASCFRGPPLLSVVYSVPKLKVNVRHRHEGSEARQDFGAPVGAERSELEVALQKVAQGHGLIL